MGELTYKGGDSVRPLFISASGRGGSTWVQDALAKANGLPTLFEPMKRQLVSGADEFAYRYIKAGEKQDGLKRLLDGVIHDGRSKVWCQYRMNLGQLWHGWKIFSSTELLKFQVKKQLELVRKFNRYRNPLPGAPIVKFIRANLMVAWLKSAYHAPMFVLLRHPASVVESKVRLKKWSSDFALERFYGDMALREEMFPGVDFPERSTLSPVSAFALQWCVETGVALRQAVENDIPVICYERLVAEPEVEWRRAADALGLDHVPDSEYLKRPSQQALKSAGKLSYDIEFLSRWKTRLTPGELKEIQLMLDMFGIDVYSTHSPMPQVGNAEAAVQRILSGDCWRNE